MFCAKFGILLTLSPPLIFLCLNSNLINKSNFAPPITDLGMYSSVQCWVVFDNSQTKFDKIKVVSGGTSYAIYNVSNAAASDTNKLYDGNGNTNITITGMTKIQVIGRTSTGSITWE